jgi:hypothetical protein
MESVECIVDEAANLAVSDGKKGIKGSQASYAAPPKIVNGPGRTPKKEKGGKRERRYNEQKDWRKLYNVGTDAVMDGE